MRKGVKDNNITITRTDKDSGWGEKLIGYKNNWCFMNADYKQNITSIDYIKTIMPIKYLTYPTFGFGIDDCINDKVDLMNYILQKVVSILNEYNIPYYLDCGTLLGCIRENSIMEHDTDVDLTIHLSYWDKLNSIDFKKYGLERTRTRSCKKNGYIISLKFQDTDMYCDIYANPAFPLLEVTKMNNKDYFIPINCDLYLTQLYGNWKVPSKKHADWPKLFYKELIESEYSQYWDLDFEIKLDTRPSINEKNLNKIFWVNYYKSTNDDINQHSTFAKFVCENYSKDCKYILDLGCGNCRDSIFFSKNNIRQIEAIDYNGNIDKTYDNIEFIKEDVEIFLSNSSTLYDIIYMRWFLHAMPYEKAEKNFELSKNRLGKGNKICIEVRSLNDKILTKNSNYDKNDFSYKTTHKRWLYSFEILEKLINKYNMKYIYIWKKDIFHLIKILKQIILFLLDV